jgi:hypothetical protein
VEGAKGIEKVVSRHGAAAGGEGVQRPAGVAGERRQGAAERGWVTEQCEGTLQGLGLVPAAVERGAVGAKEGAESLPDAIRE